MFPNYFCFKVILKIRKQSLSWLQAYRDGLDMVAIILIIGIKYDCIMIKMKTLYACNRFSKWPNMLAMSKIFLESRDYDLVSSLFGRFCDQDCKHLCPKNYCNHIRSIPTGWGSFWIRRISGEFRVNSWRFSTNDRLGQKSVLLTVKNRRLFGLI